MSSPEHDSDFKQEPDLNPFASSDTVSSFSSLGTNRSLYRLALGLQLVLISIVLVVLLLVVMIGGTAFINAAEKPEELISFINTVSILAVIAGVISFVGRLLCLGVPPETRARRFIIGAVACDVASLGLQGMTVLGVVPEREVNSIVQFLSLGSALLFVLFLKRIAEFLKDHRLSEYASSVIARGVLVFALTILTVLLALLAGMFAFILGVVVLGVALSMFVRYVRLLLDLRKAILEFLRNREEKLDMV